ncbi:MAG: ribokinase [Planctomycetota bacterium]
MAEAPIAVIGSANTDLTVVTDHLPRPGETVLGGDLNRAGGGKGANQAVAAARAGGQVSFIGRVGEDEFGETTRRNLRREGVGVEHLRTDEDAPSGVALIMVDRAGENLIAVAPGANARLSPEDIQEAEQTIAEASVVLLQLEIKHETVRAAVRTAEAAGVPVVLNPAPAPPTGELDHLLGRLACVTPNEGEAARLLGRSEESAPEDLAAGLLERGVEAVVLTLGSDGVCVCDEAGCNRLEPPRVEARDTVAAGDCFTGVLAVALGEGRPLREAARLAVCGAALSVQRPGAQPSLPYREEMERLCRQQGSS